MSKQLYQAGDTIKVKEGILQCVSFGYQDSPNGPHNFVYQFRLKDELVAEQKAAEQAEAEAEKQRKKERKELERKNAEGEK